MLFLENNCRGFHTKRWDATANKQSIHFHRLQLAVHDGGWWWSFTEVANAAQLKIKQAKKKSGVNVSHAVSMPTSVNCPSCQPPIKSKKPIPAVPPSVSRSVKVSQRSRSAWSPTETTVAVQTKDIHLDLHLLSFDWMPRPSEWVSLVSPGLLSRPTTCVVCLNVSFREEEKVVEGGVSHSAGNYGAPLGTSRNALFTHYFKYTHWHRSRDVSISSVHVDFRLSAPTVCDDAWSSSRRGRGLLVNEHVPVKDEPGE